MGLCRLNKYMAESNVCSRRKADGYIAEGRVSVNGKVVKELGVKIDPGRDTVALDGTILAGIERFVYVMLNKPVGCVTTASDQFGRKTVMDYVKNIGTRLFPVGRLDYDTSGLLLLTNDGELANKIIHPKYKIEKTYIAKVRSAPDAESLNKLRRGVVIGDNGSAGGGNGIKDYKTAPAKVRVLETGKDKSVLEITIREGRNRQVRKMCEAISCPVVSLHRIKVGQLSLGDLKPGEYRFLTESEVRKFYIC